MTNITALRAAFSSAMERGDVEEAERLWDVFVSVHRVPTCRNRLIWGDPLDHDHSMDCGDDADRDPPIY